MGFYKSSEAFKDTAYVAPGGGFDSLSEDASGNLVIADGKQLLVAPGTAALPSVANKNVPSLGVNVTDTSKLALCRNTIDYLYLGSGNINTAAAYRLNVLGTMAGGVSADKVISGVGTVVVPSNVHIKIAPDAEYTLTTAMAAGVDGQHMWIEDVGGFATTFAEGFIVPANGAIEVYYSTDAAAWKEVQ